MQRFSYVSLMILCMCLSGGAAERVVQSPGLAPISVSDQGELDTGWGKVRLEVLSPPGMQIEEAKLSTDKAPTAYTRSAAGKLQVEESVYCSPIFPSGVGVWEVVLKNLSDEVLATSCEIHLPPDLSVGKGQGYLKGMPVFGFPTEGATQAKRSTHGYLSGTQALPGWGNPSIPCDPGFRNIRVGTNTPIEYTFRVNPSERRSVYLGFCESHWNMAGRRPLKVVIEGCDPQMVDPVATWGFNQPGVMKFSGMDRNGDGWLDVSIHPVEGASDRNTILNVVWVFPADSPIEVEELIRGNRTGEAEYYVDAGGAQDPSIYAGNELKYQFQLKAGETRTLNFLLALPGGQIPDLGKTTWTPQTLRQAAEKVWADYQ